MITVDLSQMEGRRYPARRRTQNIVGGASPIQAKNFCIGNVTLDPHGGQVPWHNQEQEEVYFVVEGTGEMCLGEERRVLERRPGGLHSARRLPPTDEHRRNAAADDLLLRSGGRRGPLASGARAARFPSAGVEAPPLPPGACPQCTEKPEYVQARLCSRRRHVGYC